MTSWWRIGVQRWELATDLPLWLRAAEHIPAAAGELVPGPVDIVPMPRSTSDAPDALVAPWVAWWTEIVTGGRADAPILPGDWTGMVTEDFAALSGSPVLQGLARARWGEATAWHEFRKRDLELDRRAPPVHSGPLADTLERWGRRLGRQVHLELVVLPVIDDEIRAATESRYLVSEASYRQPGFAEVLATYIENH